MSYPCFVSLDLDLRQWLNNSTPSQQNLHDTLAQFVHSCILMFSKFSEGEFLPTIIRKWQLLNKRIIPYLQGIFLPMKYYLKGSNIDIKKMIIEKFRVFSVIQNKEKIIGKSSFSFLYKLNCQMEFPS